MANWKEFEEECTSYLEAVFGDYASFTHLGGSNANVGDIRVTTPTDDFYIEVKHCPAQCGQFVLLQDLKHRTFKYSRKNATNESLYTDNIISYMNQSFDEFAEAGTTGKEIDMVDGSKFFADWIVNHYQDRGVKFIITNDFTILPIKNFLDYFEVSGKYRVKKSGSGNVGKRRLNMIKEYVFSNDYEITSLRIDGGKLFVTSTKNLEGKRFVVDDFEYLFSKREGEYEIRKLSRTFNANVIFSIVLKDDVEGITKESFIKALK
jgi:hypothetical protein